jgi:hypothetical protein
VALTGEGDVAGAVEVDVLELVGAVDGAAVIDLLPPGLGEKVPPLAWDGSGAELDRIATAGLPLPWEITNIAECRLVAPPTGIIDPARCLPGVSWTETGEACAGRAAAVGEDTSWPSETSVPRSVARTGWY